MPVQKFRKKPVEIKAFQYRAGMQDSSVAQDVVEGRVRYPEDGTMLIATLEGTMVAQPGDWIIRGVKGELYPCKPDIFAATYEDASLRASSRSQAPRLNAAALKELRAWEETARACGDDKFAVALDLLLGWYEEAVRAASPGPDQIKAMVERFLSWRLPDTFNPDCGISFDGRKPDALNPSRGWPIGTNLFCATEAKAMVEHMLQGVSLPAQGGADEEAA